MEVFLNDFAVFGTIEEHADCLQKCFDKCMKFCNSINVVKFAFLILFEKLVGHIVFERGIFIDLDKVTVIVVLPIPMTVTKVKGFLGHTGYYRIFFFRYATIAMPLTELLKKNIHLQCGP